MKQAQQLLELIQMLSNRVEEQGIRMDIVSQRVDLVVKTIKEVRSND